MSHARNTAAMQASPRCGAQTRDGETCRAPALRGKARCRMHGGACGSGAPRRNSNAVKHGYFTREAVEERKFVRTVLTDAEDFLRKLPAELPTISIPSESGTRHTPPGTESPPPHLTSSHLTNDRK